MEYLRLRLNSEWRLRGAVWFSTVDETVGANHSCLLPATRETSTTSEKSVKVEEVMVDVREICSGLDLGCGGGCHIATVDPPLWSLTDEGRSDVLASGTAMDGLVELLLLERPGAHMTSGL